MHRDRHDSPIATACIDAVRLAADRERLQSAADHTLLTAAAVLAKGVVIALSAGGLRAQRAAGFAVLDRAGRTIGDELQRRRPRRTA